MVSLIPISRLPGRLNRYGDMTRIEKALQAAGETRDLRIGQGVIGETDRMFREQFPGKKAVIIADDNTFRAAGKTVFELFHERGVEQEEPYLFHDPKLYAGYGYVEQLVSHLSKVDAIPVVVGSGTLNDLAKLASHRLGRRYMVVATAASMDGYTAYGASITAQGSKQTFSCPAPQACLADTEVLVKAPPGMIAAGYADLFAKVPAGADWILADRLGVEPVDPTAWSIVQEGLHDALADPSGIRKGDAKAVEALTEGLMLGGFAMQWSHTSRPASGAEHQFSHLWNMEHHLFRGEPVSHGFQVSIATLAILACYEQLLEKGLDSLDPVAACQAWSDPEVSDKQALELFAGTDFPETVLRETRAKYISREALAAQLTLLTNQWPVIKEKLAAQLLPYREARERLRQVGAPVEPEEIGISRSRLRETFIRAQYLRRRFTILDLGVRTRLTGQWLEGLFGKNGVWEI